jgi:hypothetical protein
VSKSIGLALCSAAALLLAAGPSSAKTMKECNIESKGLKGEARKEFMSKCMSNEEPAAKVNPQQQKMKDCNKQAGEKGLKGKERQAFMKQCLSAK